jgi:protein farnesyltransferase/geranylgeranyltransferase type-1 subunit alpha
MQTLGLIANRDQVKCDLDLASTLGGDNPKNYQIWYHRRALLEQHGIADFLESELSYIVEVLEEDSKNYHAWSHRQWIIQTANDEKVWKDEMVFGTKKMK